MKLLLVFLALFLAGCTHGYRFNWQTSQSVTIEANPGEKK